MNVRTVLPTDLVALVAFDGRVYPNEAVIREQVGRERPPRPLETALEQWFSFATGRHTWITVRGATLRGLLSARRRGSRQAWEIDCLIDAAEDDPAVLLGLLDQATTDAGRAGAEKIFLRVRRESAVLSAAIRAGFAVLQEETLYRLDGPRAGNSAHRLRHRRRADLYRLFQLYNSVVPEQVRRLEAMTLREWIAAQERLGGPRRTMQLVQEQEGRLSAWVRIAAADPARFDIMAHPDLPAFIDELVDVALTHVDGKEAVFSLVPAYMESAARALVTRGFVPVEEYVVAVRRVMKPVRAPGLVPASTLLA